VSSYVILARKWRPAQFSDIIGQGHIVRTLTNAIRQNRIHQAYLFTGSRGVGKTSIARIFAKVIRCEKTREVQEGQEKGPENYPKNYNDTQNSPGGLLYSCDQCSSCKEIAAGNSVDVIEIDGASNNGVEAVREIRESAVYMPSMGSRKIYIIDEVHMLSTAAFNALLKTLEEPPAHVIFIFATTEPHKIPATILSRCQRFDYRRVTIHQIQERLKQIVVAEKIQTEPSALTLIARAAEGSMRDALSILDQMIAYSGSTITLQAVREGIGLIESRNLIDILKAIFQRQPLDALKVVEEAYDCGQDLRVLTRNLIEFLHSVLLAKIGYQTSSGIEITEEEWQELQTLKDMRPIEELEMIFQVLHHGLELIAKSPQPKIVLDILLMKCSSAEALFYVGFSNTDSVVSSSSPSKSTISTPSLSPNASLNSNTSPSANISPSPSSGSSANSNPSPNAGPIRSTIASSSPKSVIGNPVNWEQFINSVRKTRPLLASILEHASSVTLPNDSKTGAAAGDGSVLKVYFAPQDAYFREQLQSKAYQEQLNALSKEYFGNFVRMHVDLCETGESIAVKKQKLQQERIDLAKERAQTHPIIVEAKSLFGGDLGPIDIREDGHANLTT